MDVRETIEGRSFIGLGMIRRSAIKILRTSVGENGHAREVVISEYGCEGCKKPLGHTEFFPDINERRDHLDGMKHARWIKSSLVCEKC